MRVEHLSRTVSVLSIKTPRLASSKAGILRPISPLLLLCVLFVLARLSDDEPSQPSRHLSSWPCAFVVSLAVRVRLERPPYALPPTTVLHLATDDRIRLDRFTLCRHRPFYAITDRYTSRSAFIMSFILCVLACSGSWPLFLKNYFELTSLDLSPTLQYRNNTRWYFGPERRTTPSGRLGVWFGTSLIA